MPYYVHDGNTKFPDDYQAVEYIESTGTQYINTGLTTQTASTYILKADISFTKINVAQLNGADYGVYFGIHNQQFISNTLSPLSPSISADTNKHTFEANIKMGQAINTIKIDGITYTSNRTTSYTDKPLYIFTISSESLTAYVCHQKLYNFKIIIDGTLVRDFVPCYRKADNLIGLYDLVNNVFYTNAGTGSFIKGNDLPYKNSVYLIKDNNNSMNIGG